MKLEIKSVTKIFDNTKVLDNVNLTLTSGKIYGFVGRNGSGKSVLMKIICNFYNLSEGKILLDGEDYISKRSFPKDTRALIEKPNFLPNLTGLENLELLASIQNKVDTEIIKSWLKKLNLDKEMNKVYSKYSLGTKQKLGIAQVLMEDPKLIILDEPFNGVDEETVNNIKLILKEEKNRDKIIIIASHIKEDIDSLCDVVFKVDSGSVKKI